MIRLRPHRLAILTGLSALGLFLGAAVSSAHASPLDPWPAEAAPAALNLTSIEGMGVNDFHEDLSGAVWNPRTRTLWVCRNGPTNATSKLWAIVENGAGGYEIDEKMGMRGEWTNFGDAEGVTLVDLASDFVYLIVEGPGEEKIKQFDVSVYGTATPGLVWDTSGDLPTNGGDGAEGITFVPDSFLAAAGFVDDLGNPTTSTMGMGGLMLVGHQNGGGVFAFDLDPTSSAYLFVGEYRTPFTETAGLEFDRSTGLLYIRHDAGLNAFSVVDLTSVAVGGQTYRMFNTVACFSGPANDIEGIAIVSDLDCDPGSRTLFATLDDAGAVSLLAFQDFTPGCPDCLAGTVNAAAGGPEDVLLVNGSAGGATRRVCAAVMTPIQIDLGASSSGSGVGRYVVWIWPGGPSNPVLLSRGQEVLGCLSNPSPLQPALLPQPLRCIRALGVPAPVCNGVLEVHPPGTDFAPWTISIPGGVASPIELTLQGLLQDLGADNSMGFSVTNTVTLEVK
jgi:hypothetical protein